MCTKMVKVLIADDYESILQGYENYIQNRGHKVITAKTGEEALEVIRNNKPDIAFLDEDYGAHGKITGREVTLIVKRDGLETIIVGIGSGCTKQEWRDAGADYVNQKPLFAEDLELTNYLEG